MIRTISIIVAIVVLCVVAVLWEHVETKPEVQEIPVVSTDGTSDEAEIVVFESSDATSGAIPGEKILFFKDQKSMREFMENARSHGAKVLGVIESAGIVRVRVNEDFDLAGLPVGIVGGESNFRMRIPEEIGANLDDADAREDVSGGRVPVGANALTQLGFSLPAQENSSRGSGIKIAILDSGVLAEHITLQGAYISQIDVVGGAQDSAESLVHGTAVTSLICGNGEGGVSGAAQDAEILCVRIFDGNGDADSFTAAAGIFAAVEADAQIINISAGLSQDSAVLRKAVEFATSRGVTIVAAAGNEGLTALAYPAAYADVLAVGAVDAENSSAPFSNIGENLLAVAPGVGVRAAGTKNAGEIISFSGTSASAPLFAGTIAAAISDSEELKTALSAKILSPENLAEKIIASSDDLGKPGFDEEYGAGILNYSRLSRTNRAPVFDVSINGFSVREGSGGNADPSLFVLIQNRGNAWTECSYKIILTFADGKREAAQGNLRLQEGESVSRGVLIPTRKFEKGFQVDAQIIMPNGETVAEKSTLFLPTEDNNS